MKELSFHARQVYDSLPKMHYADMVEFAAEVLALQNRTTTPADRAACASAILTAADNIRRRHRDAPEEAA